MLELNKIYLGDCLELMRQLEDNSVDLVLTDPPYNIGKEEWDKIDNYISWFGKVLKEIERVLKDNGSFYFFHNQFPTISKIQVWIEQNTDFEFKSFITLNKTDSSYIKDLYGSQEHFRNYLPLSEYLIFYVIKTKEILSPFASLIKNNRERRKISMIELGEHFKTYPSRINHGGCVSNWEDGLNLPTLIQWKKIKEVLGINKNYEDLKEEYERRRYCFNEKKGKGNCWEISFKQRINHPTPKPLELIKDIISNSSKEGQIVLDCFIGSGTTAIACKQLNRNFIGTEKEQKYVDLANRRLQQSNINGWNK